MKVTQQGNTVILEDVKHFNPKHIFECGQCFRWIKQEDDSYTGVAMGKVINVKQEGNKYYVLKDVHGKLKKQYVTVGKIVWGDTMEIKDGLSDTDYIAFAYSKNAKEGVKTHKSSEDAA